MLIPLTMVFIDIVPWPFLKSRDRQSSHVVTMDASRGMRKDHPLIGACHVDTMWATAINLFCLGIVYTPPIKIAILGML